MLKQALVVLSCAAVLGSAVTGAEAPYEVEWSRQLGTSSTDVSYSVAVDSAGNAFISGYTYGDLGGTNAGSTDAFLGKYDSTGTLQWTQQLGTSGYDYSYSVAVDSAGNAFISGGTYGDLAGTNAGSSDAFLTKYDSTGALQWTRQLGTGDYDVSRSVAIDSAGNAFISGRTDGSLGGTNAGSSDAFLTKYDSTGALQWTRQLGTGDYDVSRSVAIDSAGNAFISGGTCGRLVGTNAGSSDAFLTKYDSTGTLLWTRQLGTSSIDISHSVAVDSAGNAFISGRTDGSLVGTNAGSSDAFLTKYDSTGALLWTRQLGTSSIDYTYSVAIDSAGNAFISGWTSGDLGGTNAGSSDAFLTKYDSTGTLLWTQQLGTSLGDVSNSVAIDSAGNAFISGYTYGDLGGVNAGGCDAFLVKFRGPRRYTLTVNSGSGGGLYHYASEVDIQADPGPSGQRFEQWIGDTARVADIGATSTTVTMPASDVEITATYVETYVLTVNNGSDLSDEGPYAAGEIAVISADAAPSGQIFDQWTGDTGGVQNVYLAQTLHTMPYSDVEITATYANVCTLTVNSGSAGGEYPEGRIINIDADTAPTDHVFDAWTGDTAGIADVYAANTTITIPAADAEITATYGQCWDGDVNHDLFVGAIDLDYVLADWGHSGTEIINQIADVNDDGFVGGTDLDYVLGDWGKSGYKP